jgi:hypothetical protein
MIHFRKPTALNVRPYTAPIIMLERAARALPSSMVCKILYSVLADNDRIQAVDLDTLANKLGRVAHERQRQCK